jgi:hypothetical protein
VRGIQFLAGEIARNEVMNSIAAIFPSVPVYAAHRPVMTCLSEAIRGAFVRVPSPLR